MLDSVVLLRDADWEEGKHPRGKGGEFAHKGATINAGEMKKVGEQLGTNPGGIYQHPNGEKYYVKFSKSNDHAKNEHLASKLYEAAGVPVLEHHLVDLGEGKLGTATTWKSGAEAFNPNDEVHRDRARSHFAAHAWAANWDAIGAKNDNQGILDDLVHTLDVGGALNYRAQGAPKGEMFGNEVNEWESMRNAMKNPSAAKVFSGMTPGDLRSSAVRVAALPDTTIEMLTSVYGPGTPEERNQLAQKLIARKHDLVDKAIKT